MCREIGNFGGNRAMPAETKIKDYPVVDCTLIGKRVREARKSSHMTQEELAENSAITNPNNAPTMALRAIIPIPLDMLPPIGMTNSI